MRCTLLLTLATSLACAGLPAEQVAAVVTDGDDWRPAGLRAEAWEDARRAWACAAKRGEVRSTRLGVIDFALPSDAPRLWVVDLASREVLFVERVAHGSGSGRRFATSFSNIEGSHQTSLGLYSGAEVYRGKHGRSLKLDGLEPTNDLARERAIVVHAARYVDDAVVAATGRAGRSWGCPALDPDVAQPIIDHLSGGALHAWHPSLAADRPAVTCEL